MESWCNNNRVLFIFWLFYFLIYFIIFCESGLVVELIEVIYLLFLLIRNL